MAREILPKNILMIGPTGVGKTEIARRLARLADAPFLKVEASKFTEVGYVGRDVESIVRDLTEVAVQMVREEKTLEIRDRAKARTEQRLLDLLLPALPEQRGGADPREAAGAPSRREARGADGRGRGRGQDLPVLRDRDEPGRRGDGHQRQGDAPRPLRREEEAAQDDGGRGARDPSGRGRGAPGGPGPGRARSGRAGAVIGHRLPRRDRQGRGARVRAAARTCRAKASSATSCRSSKGPRSTRSTGSSRRTTSSSSPPAPSTCPSPRT